MKTAVQKLNIPKGWTSERFNRRITLQYGSSLPESKRQEGPFPVYGSNGVIGTHSKPLIKGPGIIVGRKGTIGAIVWSESDFWPIDTTYYIEQDESFDLCWLYYKLQSLGLSKMNSASGTPGLNREEVYKLNIEIPTKNEQQKIAEILGTVDEEIQKTDEIISATEKLKRGLMQQLFTRGIRHTKFKKTEIGEIPVEWNLKKLQDICEFTTGKLNSNQAMDGGQYPFFTCAQETYQIDVYSFDQKAVLLAGNNAAGKYSLKYYEGKFDAYQRTYVISVKNEKALDYLFLKEFLNTRLNELRDYSVGTNTQFLTIKLLNNLLMPLPKIEEQKKITAVLSSVNQKVLIHQKLKGKLILLKKGLMQDLLSGKKRTI